MFFIPVTVGMDSTIFGFVYIRLKFSICNRVLPMSKPIAFEKKRIDNLSIYTFFVIHIFHKLKLFTLEPPIHFSLSIYLSDFLTM